MAQGDSGGRCGGGEKEGGAHGGNFAGHFEIFLSRGGISL